MTIACEKRLLKLQGATLHEGTCDGDPARVWLLQPHGAGPAALEATRRDLAVLQSLDATDALWVRALAEQQDGSLLVAVPRPEADRGLKALLALQERLPLPQVLLLARGLCAGLAALHQQGLVHGGLTPALVRFPSSAPKGKPSPQDEPPHGTARDAERGMPYLMGAGWSALRVAWVLHDTPEPDVLRYLAPEMLRGQVARPDRQADLHSVGCLIYEALTGHPVFGASEPEALREAILRPDRPDLRRDLGPAEEPLARVLARCLHAEPSRRYASATALWRELAPALGGKATPLPTRHDPGGRPAHLPIPRAAVPPAPPGTGRREPRWPGRFRIQWTVGLIAIAAVVVLGLYMASLRRTGADRSAEPETSEPEPPLSDGADRPRTAAPRARQAREPDPNSPHAVPPPVRVDPRTSRLRAALERVGLTEAEVVISSLLKHLFDRAAKALRAQDYRAFDEAMRPLELATRLDQCAKIRRLKRNYIIGGIRDLGPLLSKWERFRLERMLADAAELKGDCRSRNALLRPLVLEIRDRMAYKHARGL